MEINLNLVLFEELKEKSDGSAEAHIVILRESRNADSARADGAPGSPSFE